jgi:putative pyruvate formate lyase activating enzyme
MKEILSKCTLCPRNCYSNRTIGEKGYCKVSDQLIVARAALHMWEEPCISGESGSGTVFFSGCALGCVYCQNYNIAKAITGKIITVERLAQIFLELQQKKASNINLVTPGHYTPQILQALSIAKSEGLNIPIVYNSSGYEKAETLRLLDGYIDIYLPDFKYMSEVISKKYSNCYDYASYAREAVNEMYRQVGKPVFGSNGIMKRGVIVRHLTLPGCLEDSKQILEYLYHTFRDNIFISIMNQYTPLDPVKSYPEINRKITVEEYDELVDYAISLGVENGFIQEGDTASESFIPEFNEEGV